MNQKLNSLLLSVAMLLLSGCEDLRFHSFHSLYDEWAATDTLQFSYVNTSRADDPQMLDVELRLEPSFPMRELWLGVQCVNGAAVSFDTVRCEIFDSTGRQNGTGVGVLYQTTHPVGVVDVAPGDTALIKVVHLMDAPVRGVTDVGVKVCGRGQRQFSGN